MRQVVTIVAMNFGDMLQLKRFVSKILEDLQVLPNGLYEIRFIVNGNTISSGIESAVGKFPHYQEEEMPHGVSADDWAQLVIEELILLLLVSSKFVLKTTDLVSYNVFDICIEKC